jgi:hypothetical protein
MGTCRYMRLLLASLVCLKYLFKKYSKTRQANVSSLLQHVTNDGMEFHSKCIITYSLCPHKKYNYRIFK